MTDSFVFDAGFQKPGQSNYSSFEITPRNELTPLQIQSINLKSYLENNYSVIAKGPLIKKWTDELVQIEAFRYMNIPFTAVALILIDQYLQDIDFADLAEVLKKSIFNNTKIMNEYLENLIEKSRRKEKEYIEGLTKRILFSYIYKIMSFRSKSNKISTNEELVEREPEINYPRASRSMV